MNKDSGVSSVGSDGIIHLNYDENKDKLQINSICFISVQTNISHRFKIFFVYYFSIFGNSIWIIQPHLFDFWCQLHTVITQCKII